MLHKLQTYPPAYQAAWETRAVISRREWRAVLLFAAAVALLTTLPYLLGVAAQTPELRFGGFLFGVQDGNTYLAKMRMGASGDGLFRLVYTHEPQQGALFIAFYLMLGKFAAFITPATQPEFADTALLVYHLARIGFGSILIAVLYRFVAEFIANRTYRWLAMILIVFGGGLGWFLIWLQIEPIEYFIPEGYTFYLLYGLPHLAFARAALFGGVLTLFQVQRTSQSRQTIGWLALTALCWTLMAFSVPFYVAVLLAILGMWGLAILLRTRRFPLRLAWTGSVGVLPGALVLLHSMIVVQTIPTLRPMQTQNVLLSPSPVAYLLGYGALLLLALPAFRWAWRRGLHQQTALLLPAWIIAAASLVYFPIEVQRRLLEGIFVPLCILVVIGFRWAAQTFQRGRLLGRAAIGVSLLSMPFLLLLGVLSSVSRNPELFRSADQITALDWLHEQAQDGEVVLANSRIGNYLPTRTRLRAYIGHGVETIDFWRKAATVDRFLSGQISEEERRTLLRVVDYVILDPSEQTAPLDDLSLIYDRANYRIYRVLR